MNDKQLLATFGLKHNPFLPSVPASSLWTPPDAEIFLRRIEHQVSTGGFALITGESGHGKSKLLQIIANRLADLPDVTIGVMERPQSSLSDFYRELGTLFSVQLSPANRYGGFQALRDRWRRHIETTLYRPVLLIDEAQEASSKVLNEIRLLGSTNFDSNCLLTTLLAGDQRLTDRLQHPDLIPLGTRIRIRTHRNNLDKEQLLQYLDHALDHAGGIHLMTEELKTTLASHCLGNLRVLSQLAAELLQAAAERELPKLDEQLYFELFARSRTQKRCAKKTATNRAK